MKIYNYILINKNDMKTLHHFPTAEKLADHLFGKKSLEGYVVIINETKVLKFRELNLFNQLQHYKDMITALEYEAGMNKTLQPYQQ